MTFTFPEGLSPDVFPLAWLVGRWRGEGEISYHEEVPTQRIISEITFDHDGGPYLRYESIIRVIGGQARAELPGPVLATESFDSPEVQALLAQHSGSGGPGHDDGGGGGGSPTAASAADDGGGDGAPVGSVEPMPEASCRNHPTDNGINPAGTEPDGVPVGSVEPMPEASCRNHPTNTGGEPDVGGKPANPADDGIVWSAETGYWRVSTLRDAALASNEFPLEVFIADAAGRLTYFNGFARPAKIELASAKVVRSATAADVRGSKRWYGFVDGQLAWAEDLVAFGHDLGSYASALLQRVDDVSDAGPM